MISNADPPRKQVRQMLKETMRSYKENDRDKFNKLKKDLAVTKSRMLDNVDKILMRAEKLDSIKDRTADLADGSIEFRSRGKKLKDTMCLQNYKILVVLAAIVIVVIIGGVWIGCKFPTFERCRPKSSGN